VFNLCYKGHVGGINDIFELSVNDRIIMLDILAKNLKEDENKPQSKLM